LAANAVDDTFKTPLNQQTVNSAPLLHELQLGEQLNECVHQARRSDFSLMLAMLCDDVREQSQFILPKNSPIDGTATEKAQANDQTLRKYFDLPEKTPIALDNVEQIKQFNQGEIIVNNDLPLLHLINALNPKPLAFRDNSKHISHNILTNTTLICQEKHARKQKNEVVNQTLNMQVENWLKAVQTSIVKAPLVDVVAA